MSAPYQLQQYQRQAILSSSPEQLVLKLYDLGVQACLRGDRAKLRMVLVELVSSLNFEKGGELASRLYTLYEYCLTESAAGDLAVVGDLIGGLREAWRDGVLARKAA